MSMTPLHLQALVAGPGGAHGSHTAASDALVIIGFTISLHIAGMFALSPVLGWLTDKMGRLQTIALGLGTIVSAVLVAGYGQGSAGAVAVGLVLLGVGWSAATIAGSTLLAESVDQDDRVVVQGVSDMLMGAAGAAGGAVSGLVLSWAGYLGLNLAAGVLGAGVLAAAVFVLVTGGFSLPPGAGPPRAPAAPRLRTDGGGPPGVRAAPHAGRRLSAGPSGPSPAAGRRSLRRRRQCRRGGNPRIPTPGVPAPRRRSPGRARGPRRCRRW